MGIQNLLDFYHRHSGSINDPDPHGPDQFVCTDVPVTGTVAIPAETIEIEPSGIPASGSPPDGYSNET